MKDLLDLVGKDISRVSVVIPDIDYGTPDENTRAVMRSLLS